MASVPNTAKELVAELVDRGWSQRKIADFVKVSNNSVTNWRKGGSAHDDHIALLKQAVRDAKKPPAPSHEQSERMRQRLIGALQAVDAGDIPQLFDQIMPRLAESLAGEFLPRTGAEQGEDLKPAAYAAGTEAGNKARQETPEQHRSEADG